MDMEHLSESTEQIPFNGTQVSHGIVEEQKTDARSQIAKDDVLSNTNQTKKSEATTQMFNIIQGSAMETNVSNKYGYSGGMNSNINQQPIHNLGSPTEPNPKFHETGDEPEESLNAIDMRTSLGTLVSQRNEMEEKDDELISKGGESEISTNQEDTKAVLKSMTALTGCVHIEIQTDISIPASANLMFSCLTSGEIPKNLMLVAIPNSNAVKGSQKATTSNKKKAGQGTRKQAKPKKIAKPKRSKRVQKVLSESDTDEYFPDEVIVPKDIPEEAPLEEDDMDTSQDLPTFFPEPRVEKSANIACESCDLSYHSQDYFDKHECALSKDQKPFSCRLCEKSFTKEDMMVRHEAHHVKEMPNTCPVCFRPFAKPSKLKTHIRCHTGDKMFCTVCHKRSFTRLLELNRHEEKCREGKTGTKCVICYHAFSTQSELRQHMLTHSKEKKFHCDTCDKSFAKSYKLKEHVRSHTGEKPYKCSICSKSFARSYRLSRHMLIHTRIKSFRCFGCELTFPSVAERKEHEAIHSNIGPFNCELCEKTFETFASFKRHKLFHTLEKIYTCPTCSKTFARLSNLKIHRYTHTGEKPYLCKVCARAFGDPSSLQKHEQGHLGLKPHECKICNKRFSRFHHLQEHTRIHTGEKPFLCDICSKAFTKSSSLHKHKLVHKEKAFFCGICNKPFARRDNMVKHMRGHSKAMEGPIEETHKSLQNLQTPYLQAMHMSQPNMEQQPGNSMGPQNYNAWEYYIKPDESKQ